MTGAITKQTPRVTTPVMSKNTRFICTPRCGVKDSRVLLSKGNRLYDPTFPTSLVDPQPIPSSEDEGFQPCGSSSRPAQPQLRRSASTSREFRSTAYSVRSASSKRVYDPTN